MYIIKKSKKLSNAEQIEISAFKAIDYLLKLENQDLLLNHIFLVETFDGEVESIRGYFREDFLIEEEHEIFDKIYRLNPLITKSQRTTKMKTGAILKFVDKIRSKLPFKFETIDVDFKGESFDIVIKTKDKDMTIIVSCNYNLEILATFISIDVEKDEKLLIDYKKQEEVFRVINKVFRNQRYYYKKKERI